MDQLISALDRKAKDLASRGSSKRPLRGSKVVVLPPSANELARLLETTPEFEALENRESHNEDEPSFGKLATTLKRIGYYHAVLQGRDTKRLWKLIEERLLLKNTRVRTLILLYGCEFHTEFRFMGGRVKQISWEEIRSLCPTEEVYQSFYPAEDPRRWWRSEELWFIEHDDQEPPRLEGLDSESVDYSDYLLYDLGYWKFVLPIALYSSGFFCLPLILQSEPGWTIKQYRMKWPLFEWDESFIRVSAERHPRFVEFMKRLENATETGEKPWESLSIAEERYVRARLRCGPGMDEYEFEHALLDFVTALESLLMSKSDHGEIVEKLSNRAAWLSARNDEERAVVSVIVKRMYNLRSKLTHEGALPTRDPTRVSKLLPDLQRLSEIGRRVLASSRILGNETGGSFDDNMKKISISHEVQKNVGEAVRLVCELTDADTLASP